MFVSQFAPHNLCSTRPCAPPYAPPHAPSPTGTLSSFSITRFSASPIVTSISNVHFANYPYSRSSTRPCAPTLLLPLHIIAHHQVSQQFAFPKSYRHIYIQCSFCKLPLLQIFHYTLRFPILLPLHTIKFLNNSLSPSPIVTSISNVHFANCPYSRLSLDLTLPHFFPRRNIKFLSNSLSLKSYRHIYIQGGFSLS